MKVPADHALCHPGLAGDVVQRGCRDSRACIHPQGGLDDLLAHILSGHLRQVPTLHQDRTQLLLAAAKMVVKCRARQMSLLDNLFNSNLIKGPLAHQAPRRLQQTSFPSLFLRLISYSGTVSCFPLLDYTEHCSILYSTKHDISIVKLVGKVKGCVKNGSGERDCYENCLRAVSNASGCVNTGKMRWPVSWC